MVDKLLAFAWELVTDTARLAKRRMAAGAEIGRRLGSVNKSGDSQVALDELLDKFLLDRICRATELPPCVVVSEETGVRWLGPKPEYFILLDPVDGSNNIRPWFTPCPTLSVSVGIGSWQLLEEYGDERALLLTVNRDIFGGGCYYAVAGDGAHYAQGRRRRRIAVTPGGDTRPLVIGVDLDLASALPPTVAGLLTDRIVVRRLGSSILDFCCVAAGQYDGYLSLGHRLKVTDVAQSAFLVRAAGGIFAKRAYREGISAPGLNEGYLYRLVTESNNLLDKLRFSVVAAGGREVYRRLAAVAEGEFTE